MISISNALPKYQFSTSKKQIDFNEYKTTEIFITVVSEYNQTILQWEIIWEIINEKKLDI